MYLENRGLRLKKDVRLIDIAFAADCAVSTVRAYEFGAPVRPKILVRLEEAYKRLCLGEQPGVPVCVPATPINLRNRAVAFDMLGGEYEALRNELAVLQDERTRVYGVLGFHKAIYGHTLLDSVTKLVDERNRLKREVETLREGREAEGDAEGVPQLSRPIGALKLGRDVTNRLRPANIKTIGDLMKFTKGDLLKMKHVGAKTFGVIEQALAAEGLSLAAPRAS